MNLHFIEAFLAAVRLRSMAKASEELRVSHTALSKQIQSLESHYGVALLHRSPGGVEPTEAGRLVYERLVPVYAELKAIEAAAAAAAGRGDYTVGALPSLAAHYLPGAVLSMERAGVRVRVEVRETSDELERMLARGEAHAALLERQPHHAAHWSALLFEEPYVVVAYPGHPFEGRESVTMRDIAAEPLVVHPPNCTTRRLISSLIEAEGLEPLIKSEVQFGDFLLGYVAAGAGITFAPRMTAARLAGQGLVCVPIAERGAKRAISLVSPLDRIGKALRPHFPEPSGRGRATASAPTA